MKTRTKRASATPLPPSSSKASSLLSWVFVSPSDWKREGNVLFQPIRTFLVSGIYIRSNTSCMMNLRVLIASALLFCILTDLFVYDDYIQPRQDHVVWMCLPTNWVHMLLLFYWVLLIQLGWKERHREMHVHMETEPISFIYLWVHNLFHICLPLICTCFFANYVVMHMLDQAYVVTLWVACMGCILDTWFGAYVADIRLCTLPVCVVGAIIVYTFGMYQTYHVVLYASLNWSQPKQAAWASVLLCAITGMIGGVWYILLSAKNEWIRVRQFRKHKKDHANQAVTLV